MKVNNEPAPLYVAHLPFFESMKTSLEALERVDIAYKPAGLEGALLIEDRAKFWSLKPERRKLLFAMDLAAQQVVALCRAQPGQHILEIGSGRGTKSLALAANARRLGGFAHILGFDLHDFKTKIAQKAADEHGVKEARFLTLDVTKHSSAAQLNEQGIQSSFDTVLVDAPCSGLGTLRRSVDKRWRLSQKDITQLAQLGLKMLSWAAQFVKPGGTLLFATCTISHEENQAVVQDFLDSSEGQNFQIEPLSSSELAPVFADALTKEGYLNALPQSGGPDGHFAARLIRKG